MRAIDDYQSMSGAEKAALLLMSVGEENTAKLLSLMRDDEVAKISHAMANIGTVSSAVIEQLFEEFVGQATAPREAWVSLPKLIALATERKDGVRHGAMVRYFGS